MNTVMQQVRVISAAINQKVQPNFSEPQAEWSGLAEVSTSGGNTKMLQFLCQSQPFEISNGTITGVNVEVQKSGGGMKDALAVLLYNGNIISESRPMGLWPGSLQFVNHGGENLSDWGVTLSDSQVSSPTFGFGLMGCDGSTGRVGDCRITVLWIPQGPPPMVSPR